MTRYSIEAVLLEGKPTVLQLDDKRGDYVKYENALRENSRLVLLINKLILSRSNVLVASKQKGLDSDIQYEVGKLIEEDILPENIEICL